MTVRALCFDNRIVLWSEHLRTTKALLRHLNDVPLTMDGGLFVLDDVPATRLALNRAIRAGMVFADKEETRPLPIGTIGRFCPRS